VVKVNDFCCASELILDLARRLHDFPVRHLVEVKAPALVLVPAQTWKVAFAALAICCP
jgi:hypothetical protein